MPFINSKVTVKITPEKEEAIKQKLGKAIENIPGKSEGWLMLGFEDEYTLYFKGVKCEKAAFVEVKVFARQKVSSAALDNMTSELCRIYEEELGIPAASIYIAYQMVEDWGWNGSNL